MSRCSRIGPSASAGKKVSAPTIRITPTRSTVNNGVLTGNVPAEGGASFFCARLPATASIGTIIRKRPTSIATVIDRLYQCVLAFRPANADPLLPVADAYAYRISDRPCGPALFRLDDPRFGIRTVIAANSSTESGKINTYSIDICTSYDSIFLPRYSGVRPTIRPAMNTVTTTKISIA